MQVDQPSNVHLKLKQSDRTNAPRQIQSIRPINDFVDTEASPIVHPPPPPGGRKMGGGSEGRVEAGQNDR